jgi:hypothetical protein
MEDPPPWRSIFGSSLLTPNPPKAPVTRSTWRQNANPRHFGFRPVGCRSPEHGGCLLHKSGDFQEMATLHSESSDSCSSRSPPPVAESSMPGIWKLESSHLFHPIRGHRLVTSEMETLERIKQTICTGRGWFDCDLNRGHIPRTSLSQPILKV